MARAIRIEEWSWSMKSHRFSGTKWFSVCFTAITLLAAFALVLLFAIQSIPVFKHEGFGYLFGKNWYFRADEFGIAPMVYGTIAVSVIALLLAAPIATGAAIFSAEFLSGKWRLAFKITIELLAGIPSVVYGLLGILLLRDWIYQLLTPFDPLSGDTILTAGVLLAIMILPTIMTLSDDAFRSVPETQRASARGLGLTRSETILTIALPQARRGIFAAILLGLGRALGETIAVFLVIGRQDNQWPSPLWPPRPIIEAGQTLTSKLGGAETNIAYGDPLHWAAIVGLGLVLLFLVGAITVVAGLMEKRSHA